MDHSRFVFEETDGSVWNARFDFIRASVDILIGVVVFANSVADLWTSVERDVAIELAVACALIQYGGW